MSAEALRESESSVMSCDGSRLADCSERARGPATAKVRSPIVERRVACVHRHDEIGR